MGWSVSCLRTGLGQVFLHEGSRGSSWSAQGPSGCMALQQFSTPVKPILSLLC